ILRAARRGLFHPSPRPPPRSGAGEKALRLPLPEAERGPGGGVMGNAAYRLPLFLRPFTSGVPSWKLRQKMLTKGALLLVTGLFVGAADRDDPDKTAKALEGK